MLLHVVVTHVEIWVANPIYCTSKVFCGFGRGLISQTKMTTDRPAVASTYERMMTSHLRGGVLANSRAGGQSWAGHSELPKPTQPTLWKNHYYSSCSMSTIIISMRRQSVTECRGDNRNSKWGARNMTRDYEDKSPTLLLYHGSSMKSLHWFHKLNVRFKAWRADCLLVRPLFHDEFPV